MIQKVLIVLFSFFIGSVILYYNLPKIMRFNCIMQERLKTNNNEWKIIDFVDFKDTSNIIKVVYQKNDSEKIVFCKAIFENKQYYKCTAPWVTLDLQKNKISSQIFITKVSKKKEGLHEQ